jgi:hypothetical protein
MRPNEAEITLSGSGKLMRYSIRGYFIISYTTQLELTLITGVETCGCELLRMKVQTETTWFASFTD